MIIIGRSPEEIKEAVHTTVKCWKCGTVFEKEICYDNIPQNIVDAITDFEKISPFEERETINDRQYCDECKHVVEAEYKNDLSEYIRLKTKLMVNRAIRMLENQNVDFYDYEEAIKTVSDYADSNPEKFMSAHEVLAAVILIYNEVKVKIQYKIKNHQVDFCLPELKIILEIDGYMHDYSTRQDSKRDIEIRQLLGKEWEIVRIPTKYIEQNAEILVEAIKSMKLEKQKIRNENSGIIPEWYSRREKSQYSRLIKQN